MGRYCLKGKGAQGATAFGGSYMVIGHSCVSENKKCVSEMEVCFRKCKCVSENGGVFLKMPSRLCKWRCVFENAIASRATDVRFFGK